MIHCLPYGAAQPLLWVDVVIPVHQKHVGPRPIGGECLECDAHPGGQVRPVQRQVDALRVRRSHVGRQHPATVRAFPDESEPVDGRGDSTPDHGMTETELPVYLGHLGRMAKRVRQVSGPHGTAMSVRHGDAPLQVADQGLTGDKELVGQRVPGPNRDRAAGHRPVQPILRTRPDGQIVLDHDRLAVHQESERRIRLRQAEQLVPEIHQLCPKGLEGRVPFPVPVGVRNDVDRLRQGTA